MIAVKPRSFPRRAQALRAARFVAVILPPIGLVTGSVAGESAKSVVLSSPRPISKVVAFAGPGTALPQARPETRFLPRPRPGNPATFNLASLPRAATKLRHPFGLEPAPLLKGVLDAVTADRYGEARQRARRLAEPLDKKIADWVIARAPDSGFGAEAILEIKASHAGWPDPDLLQLRAEQALLDRGAGTKSVLRFFTAHEPMTTAGRIALANALMTSGRKKEATTLIRDVWRNDVLSDSKVAKITKRYKAVLTRDDHRIRFHRLVYDRRLQSAIVQGKRIGSGYDKLARAAVTAFGKNRHYAAKLLSKVPSSLRGEPPYKLARARVYRRSGKPVKAARIMLGLSGDPAPPIDRGRWWDERRDLARALLDKKNPALAYRVAAGHSAHSPKDIADAEFHAGWIALRYLDQPDIAQKHFAAIKQVATKSRSIARANYWLGRAHEAAGEDQLARASYEIAGQIGSNFYGQLAREKLGLTTTGLETPPNPTASDRMRFAGSEGVSVIKRLAAAGHGHRTVPFFRQIAETSQGPGEVTLATLLARRIGRTGTALSVAKRADRRGMAVGGLYAPFLGVPSGIEIPQNIHRALVYAVAKQESAFNIGAVSHAGARGLMQLMPATARATARMVRMPYSLPRLTRDANYNATLGAAHLGELLGNLRGSYILTFAGYNAGPGRALRWVKANGDPRGGQTDPIDWIERIPFDETRDYVQKVMENLQAYKSRLGYPLSISADLKRGKPAR
jgi:soluble lytic murein transglycosylase